MKNVSMVAIFIAAASILFTSCSLTSNMSNTRSHNQGSYYVEPSAGGSVEPIPEESSILRVGSLSAAQVNGKSENDEMFQEKIQFTDPQAQFADRDSSKKDQQKSAVLHNRTADVIGIDVYTKDIKNDNLDKSKIVQPISSPRSPAHSSHGLPLWFIVLCSIIIPPLGVALVFGITDKFWICLLLTLLFWLPGMIYALIQVLN
jgi:uncharacterized membrane protein YqaE (UPF0057 family)